MSAEQEQKIAELTLALEELRWCVVVKGHDAYGNPLYRCEGRVHEAVMQADSVLGLEDQS